MSVKKNPEGGNRRRVGVSAVAAAGAIAVGTAMIAGGPASAEPAATPSEYVLVGSDTLEASADALANGFWDDPSFRAVATSNRQLANYGAFGSEWIQTRENEHPIARPAGSGAGRTALYNSWNGITVDGIDYTGKVDIARSSSGPSAGTDGYWFNYGRDAVSYAYVASSPTAADVIDELTAAELHDIYDGTNTTIGTVTVHPLLPQADSGTRSFFLSAIGNPSPLVGVVDGFDENDGSIFAGLPALGTNEAYVIPFSAAAWITQKNGLAGDTIAGNVFLGHPGGTAPYTGTAPDLVPNPTFYAGSFGRNTYLVVAKDQYDGDADLQSLFDKTRANSFFSPGADEVKRQFGFLVPDYSAPEETYTAPIEASIR